MNRDELAALVESAARDSAAMFDGRAEALVCIVATDGTTQQAVGHVKQVGVGSRPAPGAIASHAESMFAAIWSLCTVAATELGLETDRVFEALLRAHRRNIDNHNVRADFSLMRNANESGGAS